MRRYFCYELSEKRAYFALVRQHYKKSGHFSENNLEKSDIFIIFAAK